MSAASAISTDLGVLLSGARKHTTAVKRAAVALAAWLLWGRSGSLLLALVVVGLALALRYGSRFARWAVQRRKALEAAKLPAQSIRALWAAYKAERKRLRLVVDKWPTLCRDHGITLAGRPPLLVDHRADLDGNITARMVRTGLDPDDLRAKAHKLAKGLGCPGGITVREVDGAPGCADIGFLWSDPLRRLLPLRDLPISESGRVSIGVSESGAPATIEADLSTVFAGATGAGKSNAALAALADLIRKNEPTRLFISNPKRTELGAFKDMEGKGKFGNLEVRRYVEGQDNPKDHADLVAEFEKAMKARNSTIKGRKLHRPTVDNPRVILLLDEMLALPREIYKDGSFSQLGRILSGGRASLYTVWGCTQLAYAADFGPIKGLFSQRAAFRTTSAAITDTILGEGATAAGAVCHRLHKKRDRGIGYASDEDGELSRFRAAHVTDADVARMVRGLVPEGMKLHADPEPEAELPREPVVRPWLANAGRCALVMCRRAAKAVLAPIRRRARGILPAVRRAAVRAALPYRITAARIWATEARQTLRAALRAVGRLLSRVEAVLHLCALCVLVRLQRRARHAVLSAAVMVTVLIALVG